MPRFSILMANYNGEQYIDQAIQSILNQTFKNWELIFVDDASNDGSREIVSKYLNDSRIKLVVRNKNGGFGESLRTAAERATGTIFCMVDSDDALVSHALTVLSDSYRLHPGYGLIYSQYVICNSHLSRVKTGDCGPLPTGMSWLDVLETGGMTKGHRVGHLKTFLKSAYNCTEGFANIRKTLDKDIVLKLEEVTNLLFIDKELYLYRNHSRNLSRSPTSNVGELIKQARRRRNHAENTGMGTQS